MREKTNNLGFRPGPTQTGLYIHRRWLEAGNFGFRKERICTIRVAKTKALISFAVTAKLICAFCFRLCRLLVFPCGGSNLSSNIIPARLYILFIYQVFNLYVCDSNKYIGRLMRKPTMWLPNRSDFVCLY